MNIAQHWRLKEQRYNLVGSVDGEGQASFPPRPDVERREIEQYDFDTKADVVEETPIVEYTRMAS